MIGLIIWALLIIFMFVCIFPWYMTLALTAVCILIFVMNIFKRPLL